MSRKVTPFKSLSPLKGKRIDARKAADRLGQDLRLQIEEFKNMPNENIFSGYKDFSQDLTNPFENLQVDTTTTDRLTDLSNRQLGTTLDVMRQSGA